MEDFEYPPTNRLQKNFVPVAAATILAGLGWYFASAYLAPADCPRLQQLLLSLFLGVCWLICVSYLVLGPDGPIEQVIAVVLMLAIGLGLPIFGGGFLSQVRGLRSTWCPACASRGAIQDQLAAHPESAFEMAKKCGSTELDLQIEALLSWADQLMEKSECVEAEIKIKLAADPEHYGKLGPEFNQLRQRVDDKQKAFKDSQKCGPTPTPTITPTPTSTPVPVPTATATATEPPTPAPTPTPVLAITLLGKRSSKGAIDFKLTADGTPVPNLTEADITLAAAGQSQLPIKVSARTENSPVCVVAVVDNSASIKEQDLLRGAIEGLNEMKGSRPNLELGIVVFDTTIVQEVKPSHKPLDIKLITGKGQNTALWLGVDAGIKLASNCAAPVLDRYLFVITDGADNQGKITKAEIIKAANDKGIGICTVGIKSDALQEKPLQDIAVGCTYRLAEDVGTVRGLLREILYETGNSYRITAAPPLACPVTLAVRGTSLEVCR